RAREVDQDAVLAGADRLDLRALGEHGAHGAAPPATTAATSPAPAPVAGPAPAAADVLGPWEDAFRTHDPAPEGRHHPRPVQPAETGVLSLEERDELLWLRRENAELRRELDVLMRGAGVWLKNLADDKPAG
ncbi:hypothetical protein ACWCSD_48060, partial [Nonomuraea sp. NPDC001684]